LTRRCTGAFAAKSTDNAAKEVTRSSRVSRLASASFCAPVHPLLSNMKISEIIKGKSSAVMVEESASLLLAAKLMDQNKVGAVIVNGVGGCRLRMITNDDIVRTIAAHGPDAVHVSVSEAASRDCLFCASTDNARDVLERMYRTHVSHFPVVEDDKVVAMVCTNDLLCSMLSESRMENRVLHDRAVSAAIFSA